MIEIEIYSTDVSIFDDDRLYERAKQYISSERLARANRMYHEKNRRLSILSEILISYAFASRNLPHHPVILLGEYGKPYVRGGQLKFNLSHSDTRATLAVTSDPCEIGCDIQHVTSCNIRIAERMYTEEETACLSQMLEHGPTQEADILFTKMWARKESFLKCIGVGLAASERRPDESFQFFEYDGWKDYICSVCVNQTEAIHTTITEVNASMIDSLLTSDADK